MPDIRSLIRPYRPSDREQLKAFLRKQFRPHYILCDDVFFDWQYLDMPRRDSEHHAMDVVEYQGRFLGYLGYIPLTLSVRGTPLTQCAATCNLMIDESCRALGVGVELIRAGMERYRVLTGTGYALKTGPMYEKLDWRLLGSLERDLGILDAEAVANLANPTQPIPNVFSITALPALQDHHLRIHIADQFTDAAEDLWERVGANYGISVWRDAAYLHWRYSLHPYFRYRIFQAWEGSKLMGYAITRVLRTSEDKKIYAIGHIVDFVSESSAAQPLLHHVLEDFKQRDCDLVDYWHSGPQLAAAGKALGLAPWEGPLREIPWRLNPISRTHSFGINMTAYVQPEYRELLTGYEQLSTWHYTSGDGDKDRPN